MLATRLPPWADSAANTGVIADKLLAGSSLEGARGAAAEGLRALQSRRPIGAKRTSARIESAINELIRSSLRSSLGRLLAHAHRPGTEPLSAGAVHLVILVLHAATVQIPLELGVTHVRHITRALLASAHMALAAAAMGSLLTAAPLHTLDAEVGEGVLVGLHHLVLTCAACDAAEHTRQ